MSKDFLMWAKKHGYDGVQKVYWTARPGFSFKAVVGRDVNQKKNPTDVLIKFKRGGFLGLSACYVEIPPCFQGVLPCGM